VLSSLGDGSYVQPSKLTLGDYLLNEWLPSLGDEVAPLTATTYRSVVRSRIVKRPWLKALPLQSLTSAHLKRLLREMEEEGFSPASRKLTRAVLGRALSDAVEERKLVRNPCAGLKRRSGRAASPAGPQLSPDKVWTPRELRRFLDHVRGDRLFALWRLGATTGMRRGELLGLTWRNVDLEAARVKVEQQLVPTRGGASFGPPKSKRSRRTVALDEQTVEALRNHRAAQLVERALAGDAYSDQDLVFCDELGAPIHPQRLTETFAAHRKSAGLAVGTPHTLRHTHTTHLLTNKVPIHVVAARIGDRPETILRTYAHLLPTSDDEAAKTAAALLAGVAVA
jgi:integrase